MGERRNERQPQGKLGGLRLGWRRSEARRGRPQKSKIDFETLPPASTRPDTYLGGEGDERRQPCRHFGLQPELGTLILGLTLSKL